MPPRSIIDNSIDEFLKENFFFGGGGGVGEAQGWFSAGTVFIRLSARALDLESGRLFKAGRLLNFHHFKQVLIFVCRILTVH